MQIIQNKNTRFYINSFKLIVEINIKEKFYISSLVEVYKEKFYVNSLVEVDKEMYYVHSLVEVKKDKFCVESKNYCIIWKCKICKSPFHTF